LRITQRNLPVAALIGRHTLPPGGWQPTFAEQNLTAGAVSAKAGMKRSGMTKKRTNQKLVDGLWFV